MTNRDWTALVRQLIEHEGFRLTPYTDTTGHLTIGVGRNLSDVGITREEALDMLDRDIERAMGQLFLRWPWAAHLDPVRQRVLIDMVFNLGAEGVGKFRRMLAAVAAGEYEAAAAEMLASRWATQVGRRAVRLAQMMRTGAA